MRSRGKSATGGSPPPMRGKGRGHYCALMQSGITPAHAGKSIALKSARNRAQDHPRPCGEKMDTATLGLQEKGSPPPMRGKGDAAIWTLCAMRITPAHAGKSALQLFCLRITQDHPRPCGEKVGHLSATRASMGSPPPMRGKGRRRVVRVEVAGITPAHAGKSYLRT